MRSSKNEKHRFLEGEDFSSDSCFQRESDPLISAGFKPKMEVTKMIFKDDFFLTYPFLSGNFRMDQFFGADDEEREIQILKATRSAYRPQEIEEPFGPRGGLSTYLLSESKRL